MIGFKLTIRCVDKFATLEVLFSLISTEYVPVSAIVRLDRDREEELPPVTKPFFLQVYVSVLSDATETEIVRLLPWHITYDGGRVLKIVITPASWLPFPEPIFLTFFCATILELIKIARNSIMFFILYEYCDNILI
jgi:hypothetical protein